MRDHDFEIQITGPPPSVGIEFSIPHHARERHAACVLDTQHPCAYAVGNFGPTPTIVIPIPYWISADSSESIGFLGSPYQAAGEIRMGAVIQVNGKGVTEIFWDAEEHSGTPVLGARDLELPIDFGARNYPGSARWKGTLPGHSRNTNIRTTVQTIWL